MYLLSLAAGAAAIEIPSGLRKTVLAGVHIKAGRIPIAFYLAFKTEAMKPVLCDMDRVL